MHDLANASIQTPAVFRCLKFSRCGKFLAAGGDDKMARLWSSDTWECLKSLRSGKKISAVAFAKDSSLLLAANKYGDVLFMTTTKENEADCDILLGHFCSVLTSLSVSNEGTLLASTDRDAKIKISHMPNTKLHAPGEIQSLCFGHTDFVSCSAFLSHNGKREYLLTGAGDGTVRMWDPIEGNQLAAISLASSDAANDARPVLFICPLPNNSLILVALDGDLALRTLRVDTAAETLQECNASTLAGFPMVTDVAVGSDGLVWIVSGPLLGKDASALISCAHVDESGHVQLRAVEGLSLELLRELQGCDTGDVEVVAPRRLLPSYLHKRMGPPQDD